MRLFSRADPVPLLLDALLEGCLVGVAYAALFFVGPNPSASAPLSLVEFVVAAGGGLAWSRLRPRAVNRRALWLAPAALIVGALGWLADPAARAALPGGSAALQGHSVGWLLGIAFLAGARHEHQADEIETSTRTLTIAFPVLAAPWLVDSSQRDIVAGTALVGAAVCVGSGLLSIAYARLRALGVLGAETRGGRAWPILATAVVLAVGIVAIPAALLTGTTAREALTAIGGPLASALTWILAPSGTVLGALAANVGGAVPHIPLPAVPGAPSFAIPPAVGTAIWLSIGVVFVLALIRLRQIVAGTPREARVPKLRGEERHIELRMPRLGLRLGLPVRRPHLELPRHPHSAVEAYLALLRDFSRVDDLGREPTESPRRHAQRVRRSGLPGLPMSLLAADYELSVYGGTTVTEKETRRALDRYRRLRAAARARPKSGRP